MYCSIYFDEYDIYHTIDDIGLYIPNQLGLQLLVKSGIIEFDEYDNIEYLTILKILWRNIM